MELSDEEYEEQEVLVYLDFGSKIDDDLFAIEKEFKLIGLESNSPVLQLGNQVFKGEWKDSLGTQVMFEPENNPPKSDPIFSENVASSVKYSCQTDKLLHMSRIFVNRKKDFDVEKPGDSAEDQTAQNSADG